MPMNSEGEKLTERIAIRVKPSTLKKINEIAEKKHRKSSDLTRLVIENYVEQFDIEL